jgi:hypothetical protein
LFVVGQKLPSNYKRDRHLKLFMSEETEFANWWQALAKDPEYYTNTEQGQKELADMIRKESERLIDELGKSVKRTKEIIWLSRFCNSCHYFKAEGRKLSCTKWGVRLVKPFHGQTMWKQIPSRRSADEKEFVVEGIDWDTKWKEISDRIVDMAVEMVNGGFPYFCYKSK